MMTKEEVMDLIINEYKNGIQLAMGDYCYRTKCNDCPFDSDNCTNESHNTLIDRLLKAEKHQETNLEHYYGTADIIVSTNINDIPILAVCEHAEKAYEQSETNIVDWLLSPYEEPKPTYKLSKFEYDLIDFCKQYNDTFVIEDWAVLMDMHDKGHFKDIPTNVPIKDILDNCEVVEK